MNLKWKWWKLWVIESLIKTDERYVKWVVVGIENVKIFPEKVRIEDDCGKEETQKFVSKCIITLCHFIHETSDVTRHLPTLPYTTPIGMKYKHITHNKTYNNDALDICFTMDLCFSCTCGTTQFYFHSIIFISSLPTCSALLCLHTHILNICNWVEL